MQPALKGAARLVSLGCVVSFFIVKRCAHLAGHESGKQMPHSQEAAEAMTVALEEWRRRSDALTTDVLTFPYSQKPAREMAEHGACRRLRDLDHCIMRVFEKLPPQITTPAREDIFDATMFIQAFVVNIYGAIDNLAWIWMHEKPVLNAAGTTIPRSHVGFRPTNSTMRQSVSDETRAFLEGTDEWFRFLESFRDALAHQIPLYVPPFTLTPEASEELKAFENDVMEGGWTGEGWDRVMGKMRELGRFEPFMTHSLTTAPQVPFHQQMICDLATVVALGEHLMVDLRRLHEER